MTHDLRKKTLSGWYLVAKGAVLLMAKKLNKKFSTPRRVPSSLIQLLIQMAEQPNLSKLLLSEGLWEPLTKLVKLLLSQRIVDRELFHSALQLSTLLVNPESLSSSPPIPLALIQSLMPLNNYQYKSASFLLLALRLFDQVAANHAIAPTELLVSINFASTLVSYITSYDRQDAFLTIDDDDFCPHQLLRIVHVHVLTILTKFASRGSYSRSNRAFPRRLLRQLRRIADRSSLFGLIDSHTSYLTDRLFEVIEEEGQKRFTIAESQLLIAKLGANLILWHLTPIPHLRHQKQICYGSRFWWWRYLSTFFQSPTSNFPSLSQDSLLHRSHHSFSNCYFLEFPSCCHIFCFSGLFLT